MEQSKDRSGRGKAHKKRFSGFTAQQALEKLQVDRLIPWPIEAKPYEPSPFLAERLRRLENFDLSFSERSRELVIDAFCEEVIDRHRDLKIWKAAPLESDDAIGQADYLVAPRKAYLTTPLLCVIEAKKDDFEQGLAQCLVEMDACAWVNQRAGLTIDSYGIVTNGETWKFYRLTTNHEVFETLPYALGDRDRVLSILDQIFSACQDLLHQTSAQRSS